MDLYTQVAMKKKKVAALQIEVDKLEEDYRKAEAKKVEAGLRLAFLLARREDAQSRQGQK